MKATELRIGNWVYSDGQEKQVVGLIGNQIMVVKTVNGVKNDNDVKDPIPLTEEILLKCGFEFISSQQGQIYYHKDGWIVLQSYGKWHYSPSLSNTVGKSIDYLHQLQNLYWSLCNEELNVEL
jgi:hypothetical protein